MENKPTKYGCKWTNEEREILIKHLSKDRNMDDIIKEISIKLERSEGGIRCEIRKHILTYYLEGEEIENIVETMNIPLDYAKTVVKKYLEKNAEEDMKLLERENSLLKLRIENARLQNELKQILKFSE